MNEFLISILSALGLGTNGVMTNNRQLFAERLMGYVHGFGITFVENGDCIRFICKSLTNGSTFTIEYKLSGKRIIAINVFE